MKIKFDFRNPQVYANSYDNIFFTSDWHFNHKNVIKRLSNWPDTSNCIDVKSITKLNDLIIDGINETVGENDLLIMLGDVIFSKQSELSSLLNRINCKNIKFVLGNHDTSKIVKTLTISGYDILNPGTLTIVNKGVKKSYWITHFPFADWDGLYTDNMYQIHGHTHGFRVYPKIKMFDAYVGTNDMKPVSIEHIQEFFKEQDKVGIQVSRRYLKEEQK